MNKNQILFEAWIEKANIAKTEPMTDDLTKLFLICAMCEKKKDESLDLTHTFPYKVLEKRAQYISLDINKHAKNFLAAATHSPGEIVMYLYFLKAKQLKSKKEITMDALSNIFPMGFFSEKSLSELWDAQKLRDDEPGDNMLDRISFD